MATKLNSYCWDNPDECCDVIGAVPYVHNNSLKLKALPGSNCAYYYFCAINIKLLLHVSAEGTRFSAEFHMRCSLVSFEIESQLRLV